MSLSRLGIMGAVTRFAAKLRFPNLFLLFVVLLGVNIVVPDPLPFADEILMALGALLLARWRKTPEEPETDETRTDTKPE
ncbi:MAG: hypothetical protein L3J22_07200 [Xanthomonadales bacterium]|nr:hypothetical protein [Xanthomonadales bacterium]